MVRSRSKAACLVGVCALAAVEAAPLGCASKAPHSEAPPPIVIGASLGLTGAIAGRAAPLRDTLHVAEGQINAIGGVLGRPISFDVEDDRSDENSGIVDRVAKGFVGSGVVAVIGPLGSEQVVKTQGIYASARVLQLTPTATSPLLSTLQKQGQRWLFRTTPNDEFQGNAVLTLAKRTPAGLAGGQATPCQKLALVNVDNAYGNAMGDVIAKGFSDPSSIRRTKLSVTLAASYKTEATALLDWKPGCLALVAYDDVAAQFIRDFKTTNPSSYAELAQSGFFFMGTDGAYTGQFLVRGRDDTANPTSNNQVDGVSGTAPDTQPDSLQYNQFKTIYSSYFPLDEHGDLPPFASNTYDAAMLIALAIQKAGTVDDREAVRAALFTVANPPGKTFGPAEIADAMQALADGQDIDYTGASGNVDIDQDGNVEGGYFVWQAYRKADKTMDYRTIGRFSIDDLVSHTP